MTHYTMNEILALPRHEDYLVTLMLKAGDSAEHPESPKAHNCYRGPLKVEYHIFASGVRAVTSPAPDLAIEALAEALAAWEKAADNYTNSYPGDCMTSDALFLAGSALQMAASRIPKLVESSDLTARKSNREPFTPAGVDNEPGDYYTYEPDLGSILQGHMLDVYEYGGRDLTNLLTRAAVVAVASQAPASGAFREEDCEILTTFAQRGQQHYRWKTTR